jgi:hypothetical protein
VLFEEFLRHPAKLDLDFAKMPLAAHSREIKQLLLSITAKPDSLGRIPLWVIFPNPGMDQPLSLSNEVASLFVALVLSGSGYNRRGK